MGFREVARDLQGVVTNYNEFVTLTTKRFEAEEAKWAELIPRHNAVVAVLARGFFGRMKWLILGR